MPDPLALKYRPSKLSEVVGQREAVTAIRKLGTTRRDLRVVLLAGQHGIGKCVSGSTRILVTPIDLSVMNDHTTMPHIQQFAVEGGPVERKLVLPVRSLQGVEYSSGFYQGGRRTVVQIDLANGLRLECTPNHPVLVQTDIEFAWQEASLLEKGDLVVCMGAPVVEKPTEVDPFGYLLGYALGDGSYTGQRLLLSGSKEALELLLQVHPLTDAKWYKDRRRQNLYSVHTKTGWDLLADHGVKVANAFNKRIPDWVFSGNDAMRWSVLAGLFDTDGSVGVSVSYSTVSEQLAIDIQHLLLTFGLHSALERKKGLYKLARHLSYRVNLSSYHLRRVGYGFGILKDWSSFNWSLLPNRGERGYGLKKDRCLEDITQLWWERASKLELGKDYQGMYNVGSRKRLNRSTLHWALEKYGHLLEIEDRRHLSFYLETETSPVSSKDWHQAEVFDLHVPGSNSFVTNGIISHNTTLARIYAKLLNCQQQGPICAQGHEDVCGVCPSCKAMISGQHPDYNEMDMGSRGLVADTRRLKEESLMRPNWKYRVYVLDEIHGASKEAFNSLLKLFEEPPQTAAFVLCTTNLEQVPYTIISRSLVLKLIPLAPADVVRRIERICGEEGYTVDKESSEAIAKISSGSMRDCLMNLERLVMLGDGKVTMETLRGENWYSALTAAPELVKALLTCNRRAFENAQADLSSRLSYELMIRESLDLLCKLYIKRGRPSDRFVDALWSASIRISRALDPELVMEGLWLDSLEHPAGVKV